MAIDITQLVTELGQYRMQNQNVTSWVYEGSAYDGKTTTLTKINGQYPSFHGIISNVVQEFTTAFNALGAAKFFAKPLSTFRQKVNFPFKPQDIYDAWIGFLAVEGMTPDKMPISTWIMNELKMKTMDDIRVLEGTGVYTANTGLFGDSMNGMITVMNNLLASGNPFLVPVPVITDSNIVGVLDAFDRSIPGKFRRLITEYNLSQENLDRYRFRYRALYGKDVQHKDDDVNKVWLNGKYLVGYDSWDGSDLIMATPKTNWLRLIDMLNAPTITDVQSIDYEVKIFMEFSLAYDFAVDEKVFISDTGGLVRGLATNHALYYPNTPTTPIPVL
jgi:hypothetical protein